MSKVIKLYGLKMIDLFQPAYVAQKGNGAQSANHLKNYAQANGLASLSSLQTGDLYHTFIILRKERLINNVWNGYRGLKHSSFQSFFNAQIKDRSEQCNQEWEECCSYPGIKMLIKRPTKIFVAYNGERKLNDQEKELSGFHARVFQHEVNHMQAIDLLKICSQIQIINDDMKKKYNQKIQKLFQNFINEKSSKEKEFKDNIVDIDVEIFKNTHSFKELRREIVFSIIKEHQ